MKERNPILGDDKPVLWIGNGIARAFEGDSWGKIINDTIEQYGCSYTYDEIKNLPSAFQITAATNNNVRTAMKKLGEDFCKQEIAEEYRQFINQYIADLPVADIITANYTYELEKAIVPGYSTGPQNRSRRKTLEGTERENQMMLYRYNQLGEDANAKRIWHVHGEACTPNTMVMSQYYYGYKISAISDYLKANISYFKACERKDTKPNVKSWVDLFLLRDVYIVGFGMDLSESDFWWLACYKKLYFPNTKIYSYEPNLNKGNPREIMANAYGFELVKGNKEVTDYEEFYKQVFGEIREQL